MKTQPTIYPPSKISAKRKFGMAGPQANRGFSLIEMITVVGIFAVLTSVVFANYSDFNVKASLDNLTHQVAIAIRQAQVYGISVSKTQTSCAGGSCYKGYGIYFSTESATDKKSFILFNDLNSNGLYDPGSDSSCTGTGECVEKTVINTGDTINKIVAYEKTPAIDKELRQVNIVFVRPDPDARIAGIDMSGFQTGLVSDVSVYLRSSKGNGADKKVVIWSTGQVSVE